MGPWSTVVGFATSVSSTIILSPCRRGQEGGGSYMRDLPWFRTAFWVPEDKNRA